LRAGRLTAIARSASSRDAAVAPCDASRIAAGGRIAAANGCTKPRKSSPARIAFAPQDGGKADQLLQHADAALYEAKRMGRGRFRLYAALEPPGRDERPDDATLIA
jgi:GGDEF domain-containing protein